MEESSEPETNVIKHRFSENMGESFPNLRNGMDHSIWMLRIPKYTGRKEPLNHAPFYFKLFSVFYIFGLQLSVQRFHIFIHILSSVYIISFIFWRYCEWGHLLDFQISKFSWKIKMFQNFMCFVFCDFCPEVIHCLNFWIYLSATSS